MKRQISVMSLLVTTVVGLGLVASAGADNRGRRQEVVRAFLVGYNEVPVTSVPGRGLFRAVIDEDASTITYTLSWRDVAATQSHLHLGQHHANGGISVFLCSNLGNGPTGTQACPMTTSAEISGTIEVADVIGPTGQGILAGGFDELLAAIRSGNVYVNIHTAAIPGGEIRGQLF